MLDLNETKYDDVKLRLARLRPERDSEVCVVEKSPS